MQVCKNFDCSGTGFKSLFKSNLNLCRKEEEEGKQYVVSVSFAG